jgi:hypothetical protein
MLLSPEPTSLVAQATSPPVGNSGFETPSLGNGFQYSPSGASWTFSSAGVAGNSSAFTNGNPAAPEGSQVAFIQGGGAYASQMLSNFRAGVSYSIGFKAAQRGNCCNAGGLDVDVYLDSTLLGSFKPAGATYTDMSTAPFTTTAGPHVLKFVGRNTSGGDNTALLDSVSINRLTSNEPPTVGVTSPSNNAVYTAPVNVTITADAADGDGQVAKVEFFKDGTKVGEDSAAPFTYTWAGAPAGSYTLTARATDDSGAQTTSDAVSVMVNPEKGAIAGKITRADGVTPVAGAGVKVYAGVVAVAAAVSGATGDYVVDGLDDGTYIVEASTPEYTTKRQGALRSPEARSRALTLVSAALCLTSTMTSAGSPPSLTKRVRRPHITTTPSAISYRSLEVARHRLRLLSSHPVRGRSARP